MNDNKRNSIQITVFIGVLISIVISFIIIRNNFILPKTKYYKITNYYSGSLEYKSNYNKYQLSNINAETLMNRLFNDFKNKMIKKPKEAYKLINKKTDNNLIDGYKQFEELINSETASLIDSKIVRYKVTSNTYTIIDQFNYKYTFKYTSPAKYTISIETSNNFNQ